MTAAARKRSPKPPAWEPGDEVLTDEALDTNGLWLIGTIADANRAYDSKTPRLLVAFTPDDRRWYPVARVQRI